MVTNGRLIFSMARDRRLPGHQFLSRVPRSTGGPSWATVLAAVLGAIIVLVLLAEHQRAVHPVHRLDDHARAAVRGHRRCSTSRPGAGTRHASAGGSGRSSPGAVIWLAYELIVLIGPGVFRDAQYYVLGALGLGLVFYVVQLVTEPAAMRASRRSQAE